ncbi:hypothetical protein NQ318_004161 [Aromia moschata]|uniref:Rhophilin-2 n=1 Tax=Aromia moschata TaxID=1265417 RepID=A0AAV8YNW0_9CUCU|nr:hypothetical protein NQ318_004161 [Aromia moschata]
MPLNERDRIEILMMIGVGDRMRTQQEVCRLFHEMHPDREPVSQSTVSRIERKYRELGHVRDAPRQGRPKINENVQQDVILSALENPHCTVRQVSRDLNIGKSSVSNIFKKVKYHPYRVRLIHELAEDDFDRRTEFCEYMMDHNNQNNGNVFLNGHVNRQNTRYWSQENPHWMQEYHTQHPQKVNVWAGVPSCQRTVAFEKACVLFNMGAVYTQIGTKQDRCTAKGLDAAVDSFLRAAGTFRYIHENFTNAPSMDLGPEMLEMLVQLMLAQARECLLEKLQLQSEENRSVDICFDLAQEAAHLAECYNHVNQLITHDSVRDYLPYSWSSLVLVKREYYAGMAHYHVASGVLHKKAEEMSAATQDTLMYLHAEPLPAQLDIRLPKDENERRLLGRAHLREALVLHEECQRLHRMCRELKGKQALASVLRNAHKTALHAYTATEAEDDFSDLLDPPQIQAATKFQLSLTPPDFAQYRVNDLFRGLGPIAIFSAKRHWSAPRLVQLHRGRTSEGFGFSVRGDAPVIVAVVDQNSLAEFGGVKEGDFIVGIGDKDAKWSSHDEVVTLIKNAGDTLSLKLVTPMDRNYLKLLRSSIYWYILSHSIILKRTIIFSPLRRAIRGSVSTHSSSSGVSSGMSSPAGSMAQHNSKRMNWNPFKRHSSSREGKDFFENVILR